MQYLTYGLTVVLISIILIVALMLWDIHTYHEHYNGEDDQ